MKKVNISIKPNSGKLIELLEIEAYYVHRVYRCGGLDLIELEGSFHKGGDNEISLHCNLDELEDLVDEETFMDIVALSEHDSLDFEIPFTIEGLTITIYQTPLGDNVENYYSVYGIESK